MIEDVEDELNKIDEVERERQKIKKRIQTVGKAVIAIFFAIILLYFMYKFWVVGNAYTVKINI